MDPRTRDRYHRIMDTPPPDYTIPTRHATRWENGIGVHQPKHQQTNNINILNEVEYRRPNLTKSASCYGPPPPRRGIGRPPPSSTLPPTGYGPPPPQKKSRPASYAHKTENFSEYHVPRSHSLDVRKPMSDYRVAYDSNHRPPVHQRDPRPYTVYRPSSPTYLPQQSTLAPPPRPYEVKNKNIVSNQGVVLGPSNYTLPGPPRRNNYEQTRPDFNRNNLQELYVSPEHGKENRHTPPKRSPSSYSPHSNGYSTSPLLPPVDYHMSPVTKKPSAGPYYAVNKSMRNNYFIPPIVLRGSKAPTFAVLSLGTLFFCCPLMGFIASVYSFKTSQKNRRGLYQDAWRSSKKAWRWALSAAVCGICIIIVLIVLGILGHLRIDG